MVPQCSGLLERNRSAANGASHVQSGEASGSSANGVTQSSMVSSLTLGVTSAIGIRHGCSSASAYVLRYPYTPVPADGFSIKMFNDARLGPALRPLKQDLIG